MILQAIGRNGLLLGLFAAVATLALAGTYLATRDAIVEQKRAAEARALAEVISAEQHDNNLLDDAFNVDDATSLGLKQAAHGYRSRRDGNVTGVILPAIAPDGYSGSITLLVGINADGTLSGVRAIEHRETPGLGDKVDARKSPWVNSFVGRSLNDPKPEHWAVKKDGGVFDQFTGATITPRAVVNRVRLALEYFAAHRAQLLELNTETEH